jgi:hypothetical protein
MNTSTAIIRATDRFHHDFGWLTAQHTFSFDPHPEIARRRPTRPRITEDI